VEDKIEVMRQNKEKTEVVEIKSNQLESYFSLF
jgi:hypothetical protein